MSDLPSSSDSRFRQRFRSCDPEETLGFVTAILAPHEMRLKSSRPMAARLDCIDLGEAQIVDLQYGTDVWIDPAVIEDNYMIHTAISGSSQLWDGGQHSTIEPGALHVTSPGARLRVNMTYRCRHLTVRLSKPAFNGYLSRELGVSVGRPLAFDAAGVENGPLPEAWRRLISHIARQAGSMPEIISNGRLQRHYAAMMMEMLLSHYASNYSELIAVPGNETAPWHVQQARAIIHDDFDDTLSIARIATRVGVSVRSLQNGFRRFLGITPVEYIRRHRLEQLHAALVRSEGGERITDLMLNCGIVDFGRYAQHYRQRYGCSPSETLRSARLH
jgi:AraC-like DNA-binding protein